MAVGGNHENVCIVREPFSNRSRTNIAAERYRETLFILNLTESLILVKPL